MQRRKKPERVTAQPECFQTVSEKERLFLGRLKLQCHWIFTKRICYSKKHYLTWCIGDFSAILSSSKTDLSLKLCCCFVGFLHSHNCMARQIIDKLRKICAWAGPLPNLRWRSLPITINQALLMTNVSWSPNRIRIKVVEEFGRISFCRIREKFCSTTSFRFRNSISLCNVWEKNSKWPVEQLTKFKDQKLYRERLQCIHL